MIVTLARKPFTGNVANNSLTNGVGSLYIDGTRISTSEVRVQGAQKSAGSTNFGGPREGGKVYDKGRWPANVLHNGTSPVLSVFPDNVKGQIGMVKVTSGYRFIEGDTESKQHFDHGTMDVGSASRFFKQIGGDQC